MVDNYKEIIEKAENKIYLIQEKLKTIQNEYAELKKMVDDFVL